MDLQREQQINHWLEALLELPAHQWPSSLDRENLHPDLKAEILERARKATSDTQSNSAWLNPKPDQPEILPVFPGYRILGRLGVGGFGSVYRAVQSSTGNQVAIKRLHSLPEQPEMAHRFAIEQQVLQRLDHPAIVKILDQGHLPNGEPFFVMELIEGLPLLDFCRSQKLSLHEQVVVFLKILDGVKAAHRLGIIHRDLKPSNILVTAGEPPQPKIIDFGIAKTPRAFLGKTQDSTQTHLQPGSLGYMSPEQIQNRGQDLDIQSDIYVLGVLLYELVCGQPPIPRDLFRLLGPENWTRLLARPPLRPIYVIQKHNQALKSEKRARILAVRGDLEQIIAKAMAQQKAHRYREIEEFQADLQHFLKGEKVCAPHLPLVGTWLQRIRFYPVLFGLFALALVTILSFGMAVWNLSSPYFFSQLQLEMRPVDSGSFLLGSPANDPDRSLNEPLISGAYIPYTFWMARTEITRAQWAWAMELPLPDQPNLPQTNISWADANSFCAILNQRLKRPAGMIFRLPTESEWMLACLGPHRSYRPYSNPLVQVAWTGANGGRIRPVSTLQPNRLGLYDLHGNVWEWCLDGDRYGYRVLKGGAFDSDSSSCRASFQAHLKPENCAPNLGFRPILVQEKHN